MPSGRGLVVFGAGLAMWIAARIVGSSGMEVVGIGLVALPFLAGLFVRWGRTRLRIRRRLSDVRVPPGTRVTVRLDVSNEAPASSPFLMIEDRLPSALGRPARLVVSGLPAKGSQQVAYTVLPQTRGRYRLGPLTVDVSDPFALTRQRLEFDELDDLLVTPQIEDLLASPDSGLGPTWGATRARQLFRDGAAAGEVVAPGVRRGMSMARSVYLSVLDRTERLDFDVLRRRVSLPPWELAGAVAHGLRAGA